MGSTHTVIQIFFLPMRTIKVLVLRNIIDYLHNIIHQYYHDGFIVSSFFHSCIWFGLQCPKIGMSVIPQV